MKSRILLISGIILLLVSSPVITQAEEYSLFIGAGPLYSLPGTARFGTQTWELGLLAPNVIGFNQNYRKQSLYYSFGLATTLFEISIGPYGAAGFEYEVNNLLHLRAELNAVANINGMSKGSAVAGVTFNF